MVKRPEPAMAFMIVIAYYRVTGKRRPHLHPVQCSSRWILDNLHLHVLHSIHRVLLIHNYVLTTGSSHYTRCSAPLPSFRVWYPHSLPSFPFQRSSAPFNQKSGTSPCAITTQLSLPEACAIVADIGAYASTLSPFCNKQKTTNGQYPRGYDPRRSPQGRSK